MLVVEVVVVITVVSVVVAMFVVNCYCGCGCDCVCACGLGCDLVVVSGSGYGCDCGIVCVVLLLLPPFYFRFDTLFANGSYNINGSLGGWFGTSFTSGSVLPAGSVYRTCSVFTEQLQNHTEQCNMG